MSTDKLAQPHLERTFSNEVQTDPTYTTTDQNEAVTPQRVPVETFYQQDIANETRNDDCNQPIVLLISKGGENLANVPSKA